MRTLRIYLVLLVINAGPVLFACSTPGSSATGSGGASSSSTTSSSTTSSAGGVGGGAPQCDKIYYTDPPIEECDQCVRARCCPEMFACQKESPFCPWLCAANDIYAPGCETVWDAAVALRACSASKCACDCSGHPTKCHDGGADGDAGSGDGSSGGG